MKINSMKTLSNETFDQMSQDNDDDGNVFQRRNVLNSLWSDTLVDEVTTKYLTKHD